MLRESSYWVRSVDVAVILDALALGERKNGCNPMDDDHFEDSINSVLCARLPLGPSYTRDVSSQRQSVAGSTHPV